MTCPACGHTTLGDLINARARAGAAKVEAEQAAEREEESATVVRRRDLNDHPGAAMVPVQEKPHA